MATNPHRQATPGDAPEGAMAYIKRRREELGIKQRVVADALGMLPGQYSGMEKNQSFGYLPRPDQLEVITGILRITQAEVIRAAGYLTDSPVASRLDDYGDADTAAMAQLADDLGPEGLQRRADEIAARARQTFIDVMTGRDDQGGERHDGYRQRGFGGR